MAARPDHLLEVDGAFVAAALAAHLEYLAAAVNRLFDGGRGRGIAADELPRVPFPAGELVGVPERRVTLGDLGPMRLLGGAQLTDIVPAVAA